MTTRIASASGSPRAGQDYRELWRRSPEVASEFRWSRLGPRTAEVYLDGLQGYESRDERS